MGFSVGTAGVAAVACQYPQVERILLVGPTYSFADLDITRRGLAKFTG